MQNLFTLSRFLSPVTFVASQHSKFGEFFRLILRMMSLEIGVKRKHKVSSLAGQAGENFQSNKQLIQADVFKPEFEGLQFFFVRSFI